MTKILSRVSPATHLHIAIPCFGSPSPWTALSITQACTALIQVGIKWSVSYQPGVPYLDLVRDMLATKFILESGASDLLFVDADVAFPPENIIHIARATRPLIGGVYRRKSDDVSWPIGFKKSRLWSDEDGNIGDLDYLPTGFLRINRSVFEAMDEAAGGRDNLKYETDDGQTWLNYFSSGVGVTKGKRTYIGEDTSFCWKYQALGGEVYLIPDLHFDHYGTKAYSGNWAEWMMEQNSSKEVRREAAE